MKLRLTLSILVFISSYGYSQEMPNELLSIQMYLAPGKGSLTTTTITKDSVKYHNLNGYPRRDISFSIPLLAAQWNRLLKSFQIEQFIKIKSDAVNGLDEGIIITMKFGSYRVSRADPEDVEYKKLAPFFKTIESIQSSLGKAMAKPNPVSKL